MSCPCNAPKVVGLVSESLGELGTQRCLGDRFGHLGPKIIGADQVDRTLVERNNALDARCGASGSALFLLSLRAMSGDPLRPGSFRRGGLWALVIKGDWTGICGMLDFEEDGVVNGG